MADLIDRQAAIDAIMERFAKSIARQQALDVIQNLPTAERKGHYYAECSGYADGNPIYDMWYCSECDCCFEDWDSKPTYNYCPNCGARMKRE